MKLTPEQLAAIDDLIAAGGLSHMEKHATGPKQTALESLRDHIRTIETENAELRKGAQLGPIIGMEVILNQEIELKKLRAENAELRSQIPAPQSPEMVQNCEMVVERLESSFIDCVDASWVFWPEGHTGGYLTAWSLRAIAAELDRRNEDASKGGDT